MRFLSVIYEVPQLSRECFIPPAYLLAEPWMRNPLYMSYDMDVYIGLQRNVQTDTYVDVSLGV